MCASAETHNVLLCHKVPGFLINLRFVMLYVDYQAMKSRLLDSNIGHLIVEQNMELHCGPRDGLFRICQRDCWSPVERLKVGQRRFTPSWQVSDQIVATFPTPQFHEGSED